MDADKIRECQAYISHWYLGNSVIAVQMHGGEPMTDYCINAMVVELLRDFIDHPIPEGMLEGSSQMNEWIDFGFRRVMMGLNFGFTPAEEDAVKNLAFNYFVLGIKRVQADPAIKDRLFKCSRMER